MSIGSDLPILIFTHEFFPKRGGIATFTEEIARGAANLGRQVEVWAPKFDSEPSADFPFAVTRLDMRGSQDISCQWKLFREWIRNRRRIQNSIVHLTDPGPILAMRYLQFFPNCSPRHLLLTLHGSEIINFAAKRFSKYLINRVILKSDRISVLSRYSQSLLERHFPDAKSKIVLTPGALRSSFQAPTAKNRRSEGPLAILSVGRLHPRKGQAETMESLAALPESIRQNIEFWIVGSGTKLGYSKSLKRKAKEQGFKVRFYGDVSDEKLQRLYSKADIFSMTSVNFRKSVEGFGLVYLEAAAHGLPIVANRVGGVSEAVSHMENGILVKPHDKEALTSAFARLIQDESLREKMGENGKTWSKRHSWNRSAEILYEGWNTDNPSKELGSK